MHTARGGVELNSTQGERSSPHGHLPAAVAGGLELEVDATESKDVLDGTDKSAYMGRPTNLGERVSEGLQRPVGVPW